MMLSFLFFFSCFRKEKIRFKVASTLHKHVDDGIIKHLKMSIICSNGAVCYLSGYFIPKKKESSQSDLRHVSHYD